MSTATPANTTPHQPVLELLDATGATASVPTAGSTGPDGLPRVELPGFALPAPAAAAESFEPLTRAGPPAGVIELPAVERAAGEAAGALTLPAPVRAALPAAGDTAAGGTGRRPDGVDDPPPARTLPLGAGWAVPLAAGRVVLDPVGLDPGGLDRVAADPVGPELEVSAPPASELEVSAASGPGAAGRPGSTGATGATGAAGAAGAVGAAGGAGATGVTGSPAGGGGAGAARRDVWVGAVAGGGGAGWARSGVVGGLGAGGAAGAGGRGVLDWLVLDLVVLELVVLDRLVGGAPATIAAAGEIRGGVPEPIDQPSTDPGAGWYGSAPRVL